jgi:pSer/pThr/pTyr-binding forkhead associated (FHA) protein
MRAKLVRSSGSLFSRAIKLRRLPVVIGRGLDSDIRIEDPKVSRQHCEIDELDGALVVRDLNSTNGTLLNGSPIYAALLLPGDELSIGNSQFRASYRVRFTSRRATAACTETAAGDEQVFESEQCAEPALAQAQSATG